MLSLNAFIDEWNSPANTIRVQTSGSTGAPKPMMVEKIRMVASAWMTCQFLGLRPHDTALLCMNLDYIAAKMMVVRALTWCMRLIDVGVGGHPMASPRFFILFRFSSAPGRSILLQTIICGIPESVP